MDSASQGCEDFPPLPCFARLMNVEHNEAELSPGIALGAWRDSLFFTPTLLKQDDMWLPVPARSDERIYVSVLGEGPDPVPTAVTVLANGRMLGEPIFVERNDQTVLSVSQRTFVDGSFEPGEEVVIFALMWPFPFFPHMNLEGEALNGIKSRGDTVTNTLRLKIEE